MCGGRGSPHPAPAKRGAIIVCTPRECSRMFVVTKRFCQARTRHRSSRKFTKFRPRRARARACAHAREEPQANSARRQYIWARQAFSETLLKRELSSYRIGQPVGQVKVSSVLATSRGSIHFGAATRNQSSRDTRSTRSWRSCASSVMVAIGRASRRPSEIGSPVTSQ